MPAPAVPGVAEGSATKNKLHPATARTRNQLPVMASCDSGRRPTPWLTGAGARSAEGTDIGHQDAEGMAYVGVRVEPPVRLERVGTVLHLILTLRTDNQELCLRN